MVVVGQIDGTASVGCLPAGRGRPKNDGRIGQQVFGGAAGARALKELSQQSRRESQFVALARQRHRFKLAEGQQSHRVIPGDAKIVWSVISANPFDQPPLFAIAGRFFVLDLLVEDARQTAVLVGLREVGDLKSPGVARPRVTGQLIWAALAGQRRAVRIFAINRVGEIVFGVSDEPSGLLVLILLRRKIRISLPASVADGGGLEYIAELIHFQRQRMADARVGGVALVMVVNGLARMREEDGVSILPARLDST